MATLNQAKRATKKAVIAGVDRNTILDILIGKFGALSVKDLKTWQIAEYCQLIRKEERRVKDEYSNPKKEKAALC